MSGKRSLRLKKLSSAAGQSVTLTGLTELNAQIVGLFAIAERFVSNSVVTELMPQFSAEGQEFSRSTVASVWVSFRRALQANDAHEFLVAVVVVTGIIDEAITSGRFDNSVSFYSDAVATRAKLVNRVIELLSPELNANQVLADRLALWGRSLVGDALLSVVGVSTDSNLSLVAGHSRRMNALGLPA